MSLYFSVQRLSLLSDMDGFYSMFQVKCDNYSASNMWLWSITKIDLPNHQGDSSSINNNIKSGDKVFTFVRAIHGTCISSHTKARVVHEN